MADKVEVFRHLILQVYAVVAGRSLNGGRLKHFRDAIATKHFQRVVKWVKRIMQQDLFSSLHRIECMETDYIHGNRAELVVQCCLIFEMCNNARLISEAPVSYENWMFGYCRNLKDIAHMRFRLRFITTKSLLRRSLDENYVEAVIRSLDDYKPEWLGLLLILKEASPYCSACLLNRLAKTLENLPDDTPRLAACLLLSFVADAIYYSSIKFGDYVYDGDGRFIMRLLEFGASPKITRKDHAAVFERLARQQFPCAGTPWWVAAGELWETDAGERHPTALSKLLAQKWGREVLQKLSQFTCCNLDAFGVVKPILDTGVLDLKCLAARRVPNAGLTDLSSLMRSFVSKHQSCPS